jgi:hypothetical protein
MVSDARLDWYASEVSYFGMAPVLRRRILRKLLDEQREEDAQVCERLSLAWQENYPINPHISGPADGCDECAAAIRGQPAVKQATEGPNETV